MAKPTIEDRKVVDLYMRRGKQALAKDAFGATIERAADHEVPANEQILGLLSNILVDESLPFYVAALDGTVMHTNTHYNKVDGSLGEMTLAPGAADCVGQFRVPSLKPVIDDVLASDTTRPDSQ